MIIIIIIINLIKSNQNLRLIYEMTSS